MGKMSKFSIECVEHEANRRCFGSPPRRTSLNMTVLDLLFSNLELVYMSVQPSVLSQKFVSKMRLSS